MQRRFLSNGIRNLTRRYRARFCLLLIVALTCINALAQTSNEKTPERVGVDTADALPLSLNEAIRLALEKADIYSN